MSIDVMDGPHVNTYGLVGTRVGYANMGRKRTRHMWHYSHTRRASYVQRSPRADRPRYAKRHLPRLLHYTVTPHPTPPALQ